MAGPGPVTFGSALSITWGLMVYIGGVVRVDRWVWSTRYLLGAGFVPVCVLVHRNVQNELH